MKPLLVFLSLSVLMLSCQGPQPRRPVEIRSYSYFGGSIERNKKILAQEEQQIQRIIARDSVHTYHKSGSGSWYYYERPQPDSTYTPKPDDLVVMTYLVTDFENDTLYTEQEIGTLTYKVDKQALFQGLRDAVKLLKAGERATFLFPSSLAYGYDGDHDKIGVNIPLKVSLDIHKIERAEENPHTE